MTRDFEEFANATLRGVTNLALLEVVRVLWILIPLLQSPELSQNSGTITDCVQKIQRKVIY